MPNRIRDYDAHIYFTDDTKISAEALRQKVLSTFDSDKIKVSHLVHKKVGPHPLPMFEVNFKRSELDAVLLFLNKERNEHDVLIHPVTGNDLLDHTKHAQWLGNPLDLDLSKL